MSTKKRYLRYLAAIWASLLFFIPPLSRLIAAVSVESAASSPETPLGAKTTAAPSENVPPKNNDPSSSSFLLLCLTDGSLYTMDAWTGELASRATTEPLLRKNHEPSKDDETSRACSQSDSQPEDQREEESPMSNAIVPGLDGRLYSYSETSTFHPGHDNENDSYHQTTPVLEALPLTIHSILENPVRSCTSSDPRDCGILTATAQTTLLALDEKGHLLWKSRDGSFSETSSQTKPTVSPLLLQRKDYWVQHVSTITGRQAWNVSLGSYQALDFTTFPDSDDEEEEQGPRVQPRGSSNSEMHALPDPVDVFSSSPSSKNNLGLPAIAFSNAGRTLTAVDPDSGAVLWKQTTPSVLSSVFGIDGGHWTPLTVLPTHGDEDGLRFPILDQNDEGLKFAVTRHRFPDDDEQPKPDGMAEFWTRAAWEAARAAQDPHAGDESTSSFLQRQQKLLPGRNEQQPQQLPPPQQQQQRKPQHHVAVCMTGNCPGFVRHPEQNKYLGLPTPADVHHHHHHLHPHARLLKSSSSRSEATLQENGILISWKLVGILLTSLLLLLFGVRQWYLQKKEKWLTTKQSQTINDTTSKTWHASESLDWPPKATNGISRSSSGDGEKRARYFRRSLSLPGVLAAGPVGSTATSGSAEVLLGRISRESDELAPSARSGGSNSNNNTKEPVLNDEKEEEEGAVINQGGIPLVRYSRYASEFEEMEAMGKGGFGSVFKCKNVLDGRSYAVKKISINGVTTDKSFQQRLQRVLREVKILAVLDHSNIVRYYTAWLEMETGPNADGSAPGSTRGDLGDYTGLSRCYSSSLLLTDSVSQWDEPPQRKRAPYQQPVNPLGWNNDFGIPEENSMSLHRSLRRDDGSDIFLADESKSPHRDLLRDDDSDGIFFAEESKVEETTTGRQVDTDDKKIDTPLTPPRNQPTNTSHVEQEKKEVVRHTLYIQMQLCSERTVSDFLMQDTAERRNVPTALRLFIQICQAVQYVHDQGLIHRDLKPSNCFMDAAGNIKVGDFGLSRESGGDNDASNVLDRSISRGIGSSAGNEDHTAGVGTRSYASPEQTKGSDYDSSTDVYSLGIMLFELCYPMSTGMERNICLSKLRDHVYPKDWADVVGTSFPTLKGLICSMLSKTPSCRPTAKAVAEAIQSILGEFTIVSLDNKHGPEMILLRVEADHREDALGHTMELIRSAAGDEGDDPYKIVQYGLRSSSASERPSAIMEFAVESPNPKLQGPKLVSILSRKPTIQKVRQVSHTMST